MKENKLPTVILEIPEMYSFEDGILSGTKMDVEILASINGKQFLIKQLLEGKIGHPFDPRMSAPEPYLVRFDLSKMEAIRKPEDQKSHQNFASRGHGPDPEFLLIDEFDAIAEEDWKAFQAIFAQPVQKPPLTRFLWGVPFFGKLLRGKRS